MFHTVIPGLFERATAWSLCRINHHKDDRPRWNKTKQTIP